MSIAPPAVLPKRCLAYCGDELCRCEAKEERQYHGIFRRALRRSRRIVARGAPVPDEYDFPAGHGETEV